MKYQQLYQCLCNDIIDSVFIDGAYQIGPSLWTGKGGIEDFRKVLMKDCLDTIQIKEYIDSIRIIKRRIVNNE